MKRFWVLLVVSVSVMLGAAEYDISNIKLTLGNKKFRMAYDELKMHLELTGNKLAPGAGALEIIIGRAGEKGKLAPGESRWLYRNGKLYIWGNEKKQYPGTLFAVYCLLEEKFGVRWLYPGDEGIVVPPRKAFKGITLKEASFDRYSIEVKPVEKAEIVLHKSRIPVTPGARLAALAAEGGAVISLCRSAPCCARRSGRGRKSTPLASRLQNPPGCAISPPMGRTGVCVA